MLQLLENHYILLEMIIKHHPLCRAIDITSYIHQHMILIESPPIHKGSLLSDGKSKIRPSKKTMMKLEENCMTSDFAPLNINFSQIQAVQVELVNTTLRRS